MHAAIGCVTGSSAGLKKNTRRRLSQTHVLGVNHDGKIMQQPGSLQLSYLLLAGAVRNDAQALSRQGLQARLGIIKGTSQRFIVADENAIARIRFLITHFRRGEYLSRTGPPLLPKRDLAPAETVKVFVENFLPGHGKLFAGERNFSGELIKKAQARRR